MADVATIGLIQERSLRQHEVLVDQLQAALDSRVLIEQAKGVIAERQGIDPSDAFAVLRNHARNHGLRLTELAAIVIDRSVTGDELFPGAPAATPAE